MNFADDNNPSQEDAMFKGMEEKFENAKKALNELTVEQQKEQFCIATALHVFRSAKIQNPPELAVKSIAKTILEKYKQVSENVDPCLKRLYDEDNGKFFSFCLGFSIGAEVHSQATMIASLSKAAEELSRKLKTTRN